MSNNSAANSVQIDGVDATAADLAPLAFAGFAHFTAMQVRAGRVRGLDLHLARLRTASTALFGTAIADERILARLRSAIASAPTSLSLTATIFSRSGEFTVPGGDDRLGMLVRTGPAANGPEGRLALAAVTHERVLPAFKHAGEGAKTHYLREAVAQGFDDAAFLDRQGRLSEATIWNLAFWDGASVVWPEAAKLDGITKEIVQRQLARAGVPQRTAPVTLEALKDFAGAAVMNSWTPGVMVHRIAETNLPESGEFIIRLHAAYRDEPETAI